jgi:hypothetical protein
MGSLIPTQVFESLKEGEASKLDRQSILSCHGIIANPNMVIVVVIMVLLPMP